MADARRARGLSQTDLARISGIEQANISAIERGHRVPGTATLHRLLHSCGFELTAVAGHRVMALPPPDADDFFDALLDPSSAAEPPVVRPSTPMATRVQVLTAALDAAEAVVRAR